MRDGFRKGKKREGFKKRVTALEKKKEGGRKKRGMALK